MIPSLYQQAIYDHQADADEDAFVGAVAGSGKSTTLKGCAERLPSDVRALFAAFNKHIADELSSKLPSRVKASTIHSLGSQALRTALRPKSSDWVDGYKYSKLARLYFRGQLGLPFATARELEDLTETILRLSMLTLTDIHDPVAVEALAIHHDLTLLPDQWDRVRTALPILREWGQEGSPTPDRNGKRYGMDECVSFDDMIFLPLYLGLTMPQFDMIYVDEVQDLNACQRELLLRSRADGGRAFWVGDERQAIYGFMGADVDGIRSIAQKTGAVSLPLSICYRCPQSHIRLAQEIVPQIEWAPNAPEGVIESVRRQDVHTIIQPRDMVLCRTNAPLLTLAFELLARDIPAHVRGREIGKSLTKIIDVLETMPEYRWHKFADCLDTYACRTTALLGQKEGTEMQIEGLWDRVNSLQTIHRNKVAAGLCRDANELRAVIDSLFSDHQQGVLLSSVHKAKGLENDRVFLLRPDLLPHPMAKTAWAQRQEMNLKYVALTRAKSHLFFVEE